MGRKERRWREKMLLWREERKSNTREEWKEIERKREMKEK